MLPTKTKEAVLTPCNNPPPAEYSTAVKGHDWSNSKSTNFEDILGSYRTTGFQATNFALAVDEINNMLTTKSTIFLGYTSNLVSSGLRETIQHLVKNKLVSCIVTTAGGIEEDLIKCLAPTLIGDFSLNGAKLRESGINRIGNLLVPNDNYCRFEDWINPLLDEMISDKNVWAPSEIINRLGQKVNNESSICYWAWKNQIPIFSPAITDGSLGDMMFFHSYKTPGLIVDILSDLKRLNTMAMGAERTGMIILGGGLVKHHICNANLMRNGADHSVFINTGQEFDGSDSGARPDEAISWGKIRKEAKPVKLYTDATLVFPLIVGLTFAKFLANKEQ